MQFFYQDKTSHIEFHILKNEKVSLSLRGNLEVLYCLAIIRKSSFSRRVANCAQDFNNSGFRFRIPRLCTEQERSTDQTKTTLQKSEPEPYSRVPKRCSRPTQVYFWQMMLLEMKKYFHRDFLQKRLNFKETILFPVRFWNCLGALSSAAAVLEGSRQIRIF